MYEILYFRGGVYKFDELIEFVEDVGGMVLKKDCFEIIRGDYFISKEFHVLLVLPKAEVENTKSIIDEIKGQYDEIEITKDEQNMLLSYLSVYDALSRASMWIRKEHLKELICNQDDECRFDDELEEILADMCSTDIVEHRVSGGNKEYRLKKDP